MAQAATGLLRVRTERDTGCLLAAEMCKPGAKHLACHLDLAIERQMTVADLLAMSFCHFGFEHGPRRAMLSLARGVVAIGGSDLTCRHDWRMR